MNGQVVSTLQMCTGLSCTANMYIFSMLKKYILCSFNWNRFQVFVQKCPKNANREDFLTKLVTELIIFCMEWQKITVSKRKYLQPDDEKITF